MKKLILCLLTIATFGQLAADPWEDLTKAQAEAVIAHLEEHPFLIEYCDCCSEGEVHLLKVLSKEIVTCEYNEAKYSVQVTYERIGRLDTYEGIPSENNVHGVYEEEAYGYMMVAMNYTFTFSKCGQWAVPFHKITNYEQNSVCKGATNFPNPANNEELKDKDYQAWYKRNVARK